MRMRDGKTGTAVAIAGNQVIVKTDTGSIKTLDRSNVTKEPVGTDAPAPLSSPVWQRPNADLSEQDKQDMFDYAWDMHSFVDINSALRNDQAMSPEAHALATRLEGLIDRASLPARARLYRNTSDSPDLARQIQEAYRNGEPWTEKGFMSTSLNPDVALGFDIGSPDESVQFHISVDAPQGAKALVFDGALDDRENAYDQREVLLQRGSSFRINGVTVSADGMTHVDMTLTGNNREGLPEPRGATGTPSGGAGTGEGLPGAPEAMGAPEKPYVVITQHGANREVRRTGFDTYDQAKAWMDANNPDTDGSMAPNIEPQYLSHPNYESGGFYAKTNRYAAIHHNPPAEPPPADPVVPHVKFDGIAPVPKRLNRNKVMERYGIRVRHNQIPADSPYHQAYTEGRYPSGDIKLRLDPNRTMGVGSDYASERNIDNLDPVTPEPDELHNLNDYSDLIDRNSGESLAYHGYDPQTDMVLVQDPESGNESWRPRKQLIAKYHPNDPYSHRVMPVPPVQDGTYRHGEVG